ncbi:MAG: lipid-A-disaccharide synthase [Cellvibrionales bacterium]|nr:lipid-A-disaccharide synthase [Cellvibrionales bacterium]
MHGSLKIGMVAGEASGDMLGAGLMRALRQQCPTAEFIGIGGPRMLGQGMRSFYPLERLAVMGFVEPLRRLPELWRIKADLLARFRSAPPDLFIGIDAPEFNLRLEAPLKAAGIPVAHYVSPSVWAWRQGRVRTVRRAVDIMLCLLPFEADFYHREQVPALFVGHPLADEIPLDGQAARAANSLTGTDSSTGEDLLIGLLPGSRAAEIERIAPLFFAAAERIRAAHPTARFLVPAANAKLFARLTDMAQGRDHIEVLAGQARAVLGAARAALVASGTATLEAMLMKCPLAVAYRADPLSFFIGSRLVKTRFISLVNLLAGEALVAERLQRQATPEVLAADLLPLLESGTVRDSMLAQFDRLHAELRQGGSARAARAVLNLIAESDAHRRHG